MAVIIQGLARDSLTPEENHALDILENLPLDQFNELKQRLKLGHLGIVGRTTLDVFMRFASDQGLDLSEAGVNAFKDRHRLGNTGDLQGLIGPQTARVYFNELIAPPTAPPKPLQINQAGLNLIQNFEGYHSRRFQSGAKEGQLVPNGGVTAYFDPVGIPTIGYGNTHSVSSNDVDATVISQQEAEDLLRQDLVTAEEAVDKLITATLNDNEFSALVSFTFNIGAGALSRSTLRRRLNNNEPRLAIANQEFRRWVFAGDRILEGLIRRREAERQLFLSLTS